MGYIDHGQHHFPYLDLQNLLQHPWMITNGVVGAAALNRACPEPGLP